MLSSPYFYALSAVLMWSTVATAFKLTLSHIDPVSMLFCSSAVASVVLWGLCATGRKCAFSRRWLYMSSLMGFLNPFLYYLVLFQAYNRLPAQIAQSINYTWAIVLVILSILVLRQRIGIREIAGVLLGFSGAVLISSGGALLSPDGLDSVGLILAFSSSFIWATYWILAMRDDRDRIVAFAGNFTMGALYTGVFILLRGGFTCNAGGILGSIWIGLMEMGITFLVWDRALKLAENTARVANLIYLTPFLSLLLIGGVLSEKIMVSTVAGLILIVAGILIARR